MDPCTATVIRVDFKFTCHHCLRQSMIRGKNLLDAPGFSPSNFGDGGNLISSLLQHGGIHSCSGWLPEPLHRWSCNCGHRACIACVFSLRYCAVEPATGERTVSNWQEVLAVWLPLETSVDGGNGCGGIAATATTTTTTVAQPSVAA